MIQTSPIRRRQTDKPYPLFIWLIAPIKMVLILLWMIAALVWLVGSVIEGTLPPPVTRAASITFLTAFAVYLTLTISITRKRERRMMRCRARRHAKIATFEAMGFSATRKFIGSSRMFSVDEDMGKWFLIDYFNDPDSAELRDISSIIRVEPAKNGDFLPDGYLALASNGAWLTRKDNDEYYQRNGVLLTLKGEDVPFVFINCYKTGNDVDHIIRYLEPLIQKAA